MSQQWMASRMLGGLTWYIFYPSQYSAQPTSYTVILLLLVIVSNYYTKIPKLLKQFSCKSGHVRPCFYIIEIFFLSDNSEHDQSNYLMLIVKPLSAILLLQTSGKYLHHNYHETQDCSASHLINFISNLVFMLVLNVWSSEGDHGEILNFKWQITFKQVLLNSK